MKLAKPQNLCLDWLYGGCVYRDGRKGTKRGDEMCKFFHALPPKKTFRRKVVPKVLLHKKMLKAPKSTRIQASSRASPWNTNRVRTFWVGEAKPAMSLSAGSETTRTNLSCDDCSSAGGSKMHVPMPEASLELGPEEADAAEFVVVVEDTTAVPMNEPTPAPAQNPAQEQGQEPAQKPIRAPVVAPSVPHPKKASAPVRQIHVPLDYEPAPVPTDFFDARSTLNPQLLALNANAPEYNPAIAPEYPASAYSYSGSVASEEPYTAMSTSAPSFHESVYYAPPRPMPMYMQPPPFVQTAAPVHPNAAALAMFQEKNAQLTAEVRAFKASQDLIHSEYQMELTKFQNETAALARRHDRVMKQMVGEQKNLRLQYERQLAALRKKAEEAAVAAKLKEEALERALRESAKGEAVKRRAVSIKAKVDVIPNEEVVMPKEPNTYFTSGPLTSLVESPKPAPATPVLDRRPTPYQAQSDEVTAVKKPLGQRKRRVRRKRVVADTVVEAAPVAAENAVELPAGTVAQPVTEVEAAPVTQVQTPEPEVAAAPLQSTEEPKLSPETTPEALNTYGPPPIAPSAVETSVAPPAVKTVVIPPSAKTLFAPTTAQTSVVPPAGTWGRPHTHLRANAHKRLVTQPVKVVSQSGNRCIMDVFDWRAAQKEGICWYYFMGLCKCKSCDCDKSGCSRSLPCTCFSNETNAPKCTRHTWGREYGHMCSYKHKRPTVRRTTKTKQLSKEELKYRERQSGAKKTRLSKRDRLNRANQLSLEEAKRRRTARQRLSK